MLLGSTGDDSSEATEESWTSDKDEPQPNLDTTGKYLF